MRPQIDVDIPEPFGELFKPHRYKVYYGGRGSSKSWSLARAIAYRGCMEPLRVLCAREIQRSISDSVHKLLKEQIEEIGMGRYYDITRDVIRGTNGTEIIFKGLRSNAQEIKSTEGIDICWCFPAGTKVDGKNIEDILPGDYVLSYNHAEGKMEYRKVLRTYKRLTKNSLYKLTYAGTNSIISTGEHPFYIKGRGYVPMKTIRKGDVVYEENRSSGDCAVQGRMWGDDRARHQRQKGEISEERRCVLQGLCEKDAFGKNESQQSNEQSSVTGETEKSFARSRAQTNSFRWKRARLYTRAKAFVGAFRTRLVGGIYHSYWTLSGRKRTPNAFQNRLGQFILWDSDRNRRREPQRGKGTPRGQEEGRFLKEQRVESVEIQKQGSFDGNGQCHEENFVYNIEVEGNNNYFANGLLVHNCEEAQAVSAESWDVLIPTIRKPNSEIWLTFNPLDEQDPTYQRFVLNAPDDALVRKVNYDENPYFPEVLRREMEWLKARDYESYLHIWEGEVRKHSNAVIFAGRFRVEEFETPKDARFYHGADWGFSCLSGDTLITTDRGEKPIKDIVCGDMVLTRNGYKPVLHLLRRGIKEVYSLDYGNGKPLTVTGDHRIFTVDGWKQAQELKEIETICVVTKSNLTAKSIAVQSLSRQVMTEGKLALINAPIRLTLLSEKQEVFDLTVEGEHEFFANGLLVHNCDPTALVRCFIKDRTIFIDREAWGVGIDLDETPALFDTIETARKWPIKADNARPETISFMRRRGFNISAAKKWQGSIEDGIEFLKSYDIVIHPRCRHTIDEFNHYSYKVDKQTGDVLPIVVDSFNHILDGLRYSLVDLMRGRGQMQINPAALMMR